MTSSATTILCTSKQTRFDIKNPVYSELDIAGLNITVTSSSPSSATTKGKAKAEGLEILGNATLKVKGGTCYALIGRNGTGKSTILKAVAEKLIPGIPKETRIGILQQTDAGKDETGGVESKLDNLSLGKKDLPVLEEVIDRATSRSEVQWEIDGKQSYSYRRNIIADLMKFCQKPSILKSRHWNQFVL
jgi:ATPase subunit of ABC transporter with duplicated ATPase domains